MNYRIFGKTGWNIAEIGLGTWQVGGRWGQPFDDVLADRILCTAIDEGVNFIDTADVYSQGMSEKAVGKAVKKYNHAVYVATKCGRQIQPHVNSGYTPEILRSHVEKSLKNMGLACLDLIQLHCPPAEIYRRPEIFDVFAKMKMEGKIKSMGVSVEKVDEALMAIEYDIVDSIQIIYNMFRHKPSDIFFKAATQKNIAVLARVPLASGLLSGKYNMQTTFSPDDHRSFNRDGAHFDKGETFSGVPYETGIQIAAELRSYFGVENLAAVALQWILMQEAVTCVIPGASSPEQVKYNLEAVKRPPLLKKDLEFVGEVYKNKIKPLVHSSW